MFSGLPIVCMPTIVMPGLVLSGHDEITRRFTRLLWDPVCQRGSRLQTNAQVLTPQTAHYLFTYKRARQRNLVIISKVGSSAGNAPYLEGRTPISAVVIDERLRVEGPASIPSLFAEPFPPRPFSADGNSKTTELISRTDNRIFKMAKVA